MRRIKYQILLSLSILSLNAFAENSSQKLARAFSTTQDQIEKAPDPINKTPNFSYWLRSWEQGLPATADQFKGTWRIVGRSASAPCSYEFPNSFNEAGLKNRDGSLEQLVFADYQGPRGEKTFGVRALNLGSQVADQGPFSVEASEPQFSLWGYINAEVTHRVFYEESCRIDPASPLLICVAKLNLQAPAPGTAWDAESLACAAEAYAHAMVYKKVTKKAL